MNAPCDASHLCPRSRAVMVEPRSRPASRAGRERARIHGDDVPSMLTSLSCSEGCKAAGASEPAADA